MPIQKKIALVYWIAAKMGCPMGYALAQRLAAHFSDTELTRIFLAC